MRHYLPHGKSEMLRLRIVSFFVLWAVFHALVKPIIDVQYQSASPSVLPSRWSDKVTCREMTLKEIHEIIDAFAKTAALCKAAGVDGVEVHAVHEGYLLDAGYDMLNADNGTYDA